MSRCISRKDGATALESRICSLEVINNFNPRFSLAVLFSDQVNDDFCGSGIPHRCGFRQADDHSHLVVHVFRINAATGNSIPPLPVRNRYSGFIRLYIQPVIGVFRMNKLTEGDLQAVIDLAYSKNNLADKTLRDVRGCLLNWLKWCRKRGKTSLHPEDLTIPAGAKKSEKRIVSPDGLKTLFSCSTTLWRGKPTEDFYIHAYRFAVLTGLRPGELRALEDKNDIQGTRVTVRGAINVHDEATQGKNKGI